MKARLLVNVGILGLLSGCSFWQTPEYQAESPSVAAAVKKLPPAVSAEEELPELQLADLVSRLETASDAEHQYDVTNRLAQLRLEMMEVELAEGDTDFTAPIATLNRLRSLSEDPKVRARVDYQLARVQSMAGIQDPVVDALSQTIATTDSEALELESRFRRAEILFSAEDFAGAEPDFARVASLPGEYQLHASYMLTWSRFKLADLDGALLAAVSAMALLDQGHDQKLLELKKDLKRVSVLALDYIDGPITLAELMKQAGEPAWQTELYRALGDWYLSKRRFADSALTWETFLAENPLHPDAPGIALEVINTQREAGFVSDIADLERDFVLRYGKQTEFYDIHGAVVFANYETELRGMLDRYSQRLHSVAQNSKAHADYQAAAEAYEIWLTNFSDTPEGQEQRFLLAEVLEAGFGFQKAYAQYEKVHQLQPDTRFGREAAYAVLLGLGGHAAEFGVEAVIEANLRFASVYPDDTRSPAAQLNAAKHLFAEDRFAEAYEAANLASGMDQDQDYQLIVNRVLAHSAFELQDYETAEQRYLKLNRLGEDYQSELLASVYKQGELAEEASDLNLAIHHFLRLREIAPNSELTRNAVFDVAALYEQQGDLLAAIQQLKDVRQFYPEFAQRQGDDISRRLIAMQEQTGDLQGAAKELLELSASSGGEAARIARYRAAELYLEAGNLNLAVEHFRFYAHNYLEPRPIRMEAMHHMDLLYQRLDEPRKRTFWLRKKRDLFKTLEPSERNDRAKYLAANAMFTLNEATVTEFNQAKLSAPLAKSLKNKQKLLTKSLQSLEAVVAIGEFEYSTKSYLVMAQHYERLATDLLGAEPPKGLNELEQEQYLILLEEQAFPFEEKAIALHRQNLNLGWRVAWNEAVNQSLVSLQSLSPAQFKRPELEVAYVSAYVSAAD